MLAWELLIVPLFLFFLFVIGFSLLGRRRKGKKGGKEWFLGPSSVAAAVGVHPYKSQVELWEELTGRKTAPISAEGEKAKQLGIDQERRALSVYQTLYNPQVIDGNAFGMLWSPSIPWMRGYADGLILEGEKVVGVLEIKCRYSKTGDAVPYQKLEDMMYYLPQVQAYMEMVGGAEYCDLMSYTPRGSTVFRVKRDDQVFYLMRLALAQFRECLEKDVAPDPVKNASLVEQIRQRLLNCEWEVPRQQDLFFDEDFY